MGQAKVRGSKEQRVEQSRQALAVREELRAVAREEHRLAEVARFAALPLEKQRAIRKRKADQQLMFASVMGFVSSMFDQSFSRPRR